jgi:hypothetical protein
MILGGNSSGKDYVYIAWVDYGNLQLIKIEDPEINYPTSPDTLTASWSALSLASSATGGLSLAPDGAGGAIVAWEDSRNGNSDIFAQRISANGSVQWMPGGVPIAPHKRAIKGVLKLSRTGLAELYLRGMMSASALRYMCRELTTTALCNGQRVEFPY